MEAQHISAGAAMLGEPLLGQTEPSQTELQRQDSRSRAPLMPQRQDSRLKAAIKQVMVLDTMGGPVAREVTTNQLKERFFILGMQAGVAFQMFIMSAIIMVVITSGSESSIEELSRVYYPLFRGLFFISFFVSCYGINLFCWKRFGINYNSILGVGSRHNYHFVIRIAFMLMTLVFGCFMLYVLTLRSPDLEFLPDKHIWPAIALGGTFALALWPSDIMREWQARVDELTKS